MDEAALGDQQQSIPLRGVEGSGQFDVPLDAIDPARLGLVVDAVLRVNP